MTKIASKITLIILMLAVMLSACDVLLEDTTGTQEATNPPGDATLEPFPTFAPEAGITPVDTEKLTLAIGYGERGPWWDVYFTDPTNPNADQETGGIDVPLIEAIDAATLSVDVAIYSLSLPSIGDALIRAHQRGVTVRMVMESENMDNDVVRAVQAAGIPLRGDENSSGLMHDKFTVIDHAEVWTGSTNYTASGVYHDNNNMIRVLSEKIAEDYTTEFNEMFDEGLFGSKDRAVTPYPAIRIVDTNVEVMFSPDDGVTRRITTSILGATQSVYFMGYSFTSNEILSALETQFAKGIKVAGVLEQSQAKSAVGARILQVFYVAGMDVLLDGNSGLMHHKVIIIDQRTVITGSFNFTKSAETRNDENIIILSDPAIAALYYAEFQRVFALGTPIPKPEPSPTATP
jgi:phosphatidylserine/phosphatidylglycerophosphate/cardiolipin synthase-like enzyme